MRSARIPFIVPEKQISMSDADKKIRGFRDDRLSGDPSVRTNHFFPVSNEHEQSTWYFLLCGKWEKIVRGISVSVHLNRCTVRLYGYIKVCLIKNDSLPRYTPDVFREVMEQTENTSNVL